MKSTALRWAPGLAIVVVVALIPGRMWIQRQANGSTAAGLPRTEALMHAARVRLRPLLTTPLTMIFGRVPLAVALTNGSEQRAPMGQAVVGGVVTSSLLTLRVVPVVYCTLDDLAVWARRLMGRTPRSVTPAK